MNIYLLMAACRDDDGNIKSHIIHTAYSSLESATKSCEMRNNGIFNKDRHWFVVRVGHDQT